MESVGAQGSKQIMDVIKPYKFIRFGAMDVTKPVVQSVVPGRFPSGIY